MLRLDVTFTLLLAGLVAVGLSSCKTDPDTTTPAVSAQQLAEVPCTCGEEDAELLGCMCESCLSGVGNRDNPYCTCTGLRVVALSEGFDPKDPSGDAEMIFTAGGSRLKGKQAIRTANGRTIYGWITSDDGAEINVRLDPAGSTRLKYSQLDPHTVYRLKLGRMDMEDAEGHLELGQYALEHQLFDSAQARHEFDRLGASVRESQPSEPGQGRGQLQLSPRGFVERELLQVR